MLCDCLLILKILVSVRQFSVSSDTGAPVQYWLPRPGGILPVDHLLLQGIKGIKVFIISVQM